MHSKNRQCFARRDAGPSRAASPWATARDSTRPGYTSPVTTRPAFKSCRTQVSISVTSLHSTEQDLSYNFVTTSGKPVKSIIRIVVVYNLLQEQYGEGAA